MSTRTTKNGKYLSDKTISELNDQHGWFQYEDAQSDVSRAFANNAVHAFLEIAKEAEQAKQETGMTPMELVLQIYELKARIAELEKHESNLIAKRDHCEEVIDRMADAVLGKDRHEWTSNYDYMDAAQEVEDRIAELEKDAARYRLASEQDTFCDFVMHAFGLYCDDKESADRVIDTAMKGI